MRVENYDTMRASYLMVYPLGRFFHNCVSQNSKTYRYSEPIHEVGARKAFFQITFDAQAFDARYTAERFIAEEAK